MKEGVVAPSLQPFLLKHKQSQKKRDSWHPFEDAALTEGVRKHGNKFAKILEENPLVLQVTSPHFWTSVFWGTHVTRIVPTKIA